MKALASLLAIVSALPLHAAFISSAERLDPSPLPGITLTHNFFGGGQVWNNYEFLFGTPQNYLVGGDLIRTRYNDDVDDADFQLRLTLDVPATLYLFIDDHVADVATKMPWVSALGFVDTGNNVPVLIAPDNTQLSIYIANFPAGDVVLLAQNDPNGPGGRHSGMYVVGAVPEPASLLLILCGALACSTRRPSRVSSHVP